ncbi:hypothetical protein ACVDG8_002450 [Mesorhizobium sp. ORM8.1]
MDFDNAPLPLNLVILVDHLRRRANEDPRTPGQIADALGVEAQKVYRFRRGIIQNYDLEFLTAMLAHYIPHAAINLETHHPFGKPLEVESASVTQPTLVLLTPIRPAA